MQRAVWILTLVTLAIAGCGEIDWFPETVKSSTSPNAFSFTAKSNVQPGDTIPSDSITVAGIPSGAAPIKVSGDASSKYSINGATFTNISTGTIKNNDKVVVQHGASSDFLTSVSTTLTIGDKSETFTSTTAKVKRLTFADKTSQSPNLPVSSNSQTVEGVNNGIFTIFVTGGNSSKYAILTSAPANNDCSSIADSLFTESQGTVSVGNVVCLRHNTALDTNTNVITTLTIDTVPSTFKSTTAP